MEKEPVIPYTARPSVFARPVRRFAAVFGLAVAVTLLAPAAPVHAQRAAPASFADLAERLLPAVVNISTTQTIPPRGEGRGDGRGEGRGDQRGERGPELPQFPPGSPFEEFFRDFFERQGRTPNAPPPRRATSLGSGFIIDAKEAYVVTNNHVIDGADEINVILQDDTTIRATLVGRDPKTDLALLKITPPANRTLTAVPFGNSDKSRVGDWVLAIGNPFGLGGTVTAGIISARARNIQQGPYDDFLQTDASINRGNSGGPMFNLDGEVVGINTAIFSPTGASVGIGFAIPANLAKGVVAQLREFGRTRRGWLGVRIQGVSDEIAESLGLDKARGALVASTTGNGPAAEAGIQPGDVVLTFNGRPIETSARLPRIVAETPVDARVPVQVWRKGQQIDMLVKVGELEAAEQQGLLASVPPEQQRAAPPAVEALGLKLSNLSTELRQQFDIGPDVKGVVVTDVAAESAAAGRGLRPGDVIVEVGQEAVAAPAEVQQKIRRARDQGRRSILLLVDRQGDLRFVALNLPG
jgi:serine protease Do